MNWFILNNEIYFSSNSINQKPSASFIYYAEFKNKNLETGESISKPSSTLTDISFQKDPFDLIISLVSKNKKIYFEIFLSNKSIRYSVSLNQIKDDYLILENKWIPIIPGKTNDLRTLLIENNIDEKEINLKQSFELKESSKQYGILIEENIKNEQLVTLEIEENNYFNATLYEYQKAGYNWMKFMLLQNIGFVLADEMGLGKSIQIIRLICFQFENNKKPFLIIVPASLLENWRRELNKFTNGFNILIHQGSKRSGSPNYLSKFDIVLTSYETVISDLILLKMINWDMVIADEAQAIKNPDALRTRSLKQLNKNISIAVTGTPFENKISDVWSIIDFVYPNYLSSLSKFDQLYNNDINGATDLEPHVSPLILRRKVLDVAKDLPEKIVSEIAITMDESMQIGYEEIRNRFVNTNSYKSIFALIIQLRMFCCDPRLVGINNQSIRNSKFEYLIFLLTEIIALNEKVIVFTSYHKMADIIKDFIENKLMVYCECIDGRVPVVDRQTIIDRFTDITTSGILILNPKAAGTGLNITAANHVIHYNVEWNPAVEDQATARAYRRGQSKPVRVYKLFYLNTIDELINDRVFSKRIISDSAIVGVNGATTNYEDLLKAFNVSPII